ncbi:hypothetical protein Ddc_05409 [Ditylenchus destructor]|nr:hypothetical protein Ddc_05409 [Ditylenchus destructor]
MMIVSVSVGLLSVTLLPIWEHDEVSGGPSWSRGGVFVCFKKRILSGKGPICAPAQLRAINRPQDLFFLLFPPGVEKKQ